MGILPAGTEIMSENGYDWFTDEHFTVMFEMDRKALVPTVVLDILNQYNY